MRILKVLLLALVAAAVVCPLAQAGVISEDVVYWLNDGASWRNPPTEALENNADKLMLKVQQTVYDNAWTRTITESDTPGYLFAYSVTNLTYNPPEGYGLKFFEVTWGVMPLGGYVAISPQNPIAQKDGSGMWITSGWVPSVAGMNPRIYWQLRETQPIPVDPGLLPGSTVTFWAISPIARDSYPVLAKAAGTSDPTGQYPFLRGHTTGPVPEPAAVAALASTLGGMAVLAYRKRRRRPT